MKCCAIQAVARLRYILVCSQFAADGFDLDARPIKSQTGGSSMFRTKFWPTFAHYTQR